MTSHRILTLRELTIKHQRLRVIKLQLEKLDDLTVETVISLKNELEELDKEISIHYKLMKIKSSGFKIID